MDTASENIAENKSGSEGVIPGCKEIIVSHG